VINGTGWAGMTDAGYLVHEAGNGAEALTLARRHRVDVILMDLQMPVMDGMEAIRQLRADSMTAALPILVLTAQGTDESVDQARRAGRMRISRSRSGPETLMHHIRAVWGRPRGAREEMVRVRAGSLCCIN